MGLILLALLFVALFVGIGFAVHVLWWLAVIAAVFLLVAIVIHILDRPSRL